ncbi:MAG: hypothetical protein ATN31_04190 [Candidatus Epulonipiscioides saccharophilum]|nr:MAG: hypothetical protein ATN31_04190 [Epulopiscium sp. AS2M-Bin001]
MEISYLIHTRTFSFDFNPNFMVRPKDWQPEHILWARRNVLLATSSIDTLVDGRYLIGTTPKGDYKIIGIADYLSNFVKHCNQDIKKQASKFLKDTHNRRTYAFIGIIIKGIEAINITNITKEFLFSIYMKQLDPIWYTNTNLNTIEIPFHNIDNLLSLNSLNPSQAISLPTLTLKNTKLYNQQFNPDLLHTYASSLKNNFVFSTDITSLKQIEKLFDYDSTYILSAPNNIISKLEDILLNENKPLDYSAETLKTDLPNPNNISGQIKSEREKKNLPIITTKNLPSIQKTLLPPTLIAVGLGSAILTALATIISLLI